MLHKWKLLNSKIAFDNPWFSVRQDAVQLPSGKVLDDYDVWLQGDIVLVVACTSAHDMVLVRQYRHGVREMLIEHPAGYVDEGENPEGTARRELLEETGFSAGDLRPLATFTSMPSKVVRTDDCFSRHTCDEGGRGSPRRYGRDRSARATVAQCAGNGATRGNVVNVLCGRHVAGD